MLKPKVFILLAAYNGERYIKDQLKSIINQTVRPYKIFINIDKSSDKTLEILKRYQKNFPEINIINTDKNFGSAGSNFLYMFRKVDFTNADFIALSDQDDIWKKDKIEVSLRFLQNGFDCYSSNVEAFWENGRKKILYKNQKQTKYDYLFESAGPGCSFVLSKHISLSLQKFLKSNDDSYFDKYHDWFIYAFARSTGYKWHIDSYPSLFYRQHSNNVLGANVGIKAFLSRTRSVLFGNGFDFSFLLMRSLIRNDKFIKSLFPITRMSFLKLVLTAKHCRRKSFDLFLFIIACLIFIIFFPNKLKNFK